MAVARATYTFLAFLLFACSGSAVAALIDDRATRDTLSTGTQLDSLDLGGRTFSDAVAAVEDEIKAPLLAPMTLRIANKTVRVDVRNLARVDAYGLVRRLLNRQRSVGVLLRAASRLEMLVVGRAQAVGNGDEVTPETYPVAIDALSEKLARKFGRLPRDASITVSPEGFGVIPARMGLSIDSDEAADAIDDAIVASDREITLPVRHLRPKVTTKNLGTSLFVRISERKVYLYEGAKLVKTYRCAVGTWSHPTPRGWWEIINKRYMPSWSNPGSAWAKDMPRSIPPGPSNPLGTRALDLNAAGIRFHGTTKDYSIGTAASHGCMRMHRWDIEDLYPRVPVGTRVIIVD